MIRNILSLLLIASALAATAFTVYDHVSMSCEERVEYRCQEYHDVQACMEWQKGNC